MAHANFIHVREMIKMYDYFVKAIKPVHTLLLKTTAKKKRIKLFITIYLSSEFDVIKHICNQNGLKINVYTHSLMCVMLNLPKYHAIMSKLKKNNSLNKYIELNSEAKRQINKR